MSTYSDASLILPVAPEYKAGKIYSLKPTDGSGDFTVDRGTGSTGIRHKVNSDLKLELIGSDVPAFNFDAIGGCPVLNTEPQATNLITYPISFGNSYWTKSGATIEGDPSTAGSEVIAGTLVLTDGSGWDYNFGPVTFSGAGASFNANDDRLVKTTLLTVGQLYLCEVNITTNTATRFDIDNNGYPIYKSLTGTGVQSFYFTASSASFRIVQVGAGTVVVASLSVKAVDGFSAPSVDFPTSAFKLVENNATSDHSTYSTFGVLTSSKYTFSAFVKKGERYKMSLADRNTGAYASFNLNDGTLIEQLSMTSTIELLSNGWYKLSITTTSAVTVLVPQIFVLEDSYTTGLPILATYLGDGTSGIYIFMAQFEVGSAATSPTFTDTTLAAEGSTTTRLADVVNNLSATSYTNSLSGVLFAEINTLGNEGTYRTLSLNDSVSTNRVEMYYRPTAEQITFFVNIGGGNIINYTHTFTDATVMHKVAIKWSIGDFGVFVNGVKVNSSNSTAVFASNALTKLSFTNSTGGEIFSGNTKQLQVYGTALTDAECITLTTL